MKYFDDHRKPRLSELVDMNDRKDVIDSIAEIFSYSFPNADFSDVRSVFNHVGAMYDGKVSGYQACDINYHDFRHTEDVALATARMIDGAILSGFEFSPDMVKIAIIAAVMHDVGYLKESGDNDGTGAKYTKTHVARSGDFMYDFFGKYNKKGTSETTRNMIDCTDLMKKPKDIPFKTESAKVLGMILGSADLIAQMADRTYLEKLPHLYDEFVQGGIPAYSDAFDLLAKTAGFYKVQKARLEDDLNSMYSFAGLHFSKRLGIDSDLYSEAIDSNFSYLEKVVAAGKEGYGKLLRRDI